MSLVSHVSQHMYLYCMQAACTPQKFDSKTQKTQWLLYEYCFSGEQPSLSSQSSNPLTHRMLCISACICVLVSGISMHITCLLDANTVHVYE